MQTVDIGVFWGSSITKMCLTWFLNRKANEVLVRKWSIECTKAASYCQFTLNCSSQAIVHPARYLLEFAITGVKTSKVLITSA